ARTPALGGRGGHEMRAGREASTAEERAAAAGREASSAEERAAAAVREASSAEERAAAAGRRPAEARRAAEARGGSGPVPAPEREDARERGCSARRAPGRCRPPWVPRPHVGGCGRRS